MYKRDSDDLFSSRVVLDAAIPLITRLTLTGDLRVEHKLLGILCALFKNHTLIIWVTCTAHAC